MLFANNKDTWYNSFKIKTLVVSANLLLLGFILKLEITTSKEKNRSKMERVNIGSAKVSNSACAEKAAAGLFVNSTDSCSYYTQ